MTLTEIWLDSAGAQRQHIDYTIGDTVVSRLSGREGKVTELYPTSNRAVVATEGGGITSCEATTLELAPGTLTDTERLDWIFQQADDYSCGILQDQPGDGVYLVTGMEAMGTGVSPRDALDAAVVDQRARLVKNGRSCAHCNDTGDVHDQQGECRGRCSCPAGKWSRSDQQWAEKAMEDQAEQFRLDAHEREAMRDAECCIEVVAASQASKLSK